MARLFTEGLEMADPLAFHSVYGAVTFTTATKRSGAYGLQLGYRDSWAKVDITDTNELFIRLPINAASGIMLYWLSDVTTSMGYISANASHLMEVRVGTTLVATGAKVLSTSGWDLVEIRIKIADSGGIIQTKVNGIDDINYSGDTKPSTATNISFIQFFGNGHVFDDIAINDTSGAVDNSWCGDGHVIALVPNVNGDLSQLTGSDGNSTDNYLLVDETPSNSDTDYVEGSTVDEKDLYNLAASGLSNVNISRVWGESRSKDTVTAGGLLAITIKTEGTEYDSGDIALSTSYTAIKGPEYLVNPQTGIAWTVAELDALQVGPKTRS